MNEPFFSSLPPASAFYDHASSCWRMSQASFQLDLDEEADWTLLQRLPDWGTTAGGALFEQVMPLLLTAVRDGFALLGTPTTVLSPRSERFQRGTAPTPIELAALLATPTAWLGHRPVHAKGDPERWHNPERSNDLSDQMATLLPTPRTSDHSGPGLHGNGGPDLRTAISLLPTPISSDHLRPARGDGQLRTAIGLGDDLWDRPHLLPTPTVNDSHNNPPPPSQFNRDTLALPVVMTLLPTPQAADAKTFGPNMDWQLRLTNHAPSTASVLMNLPSSDGNTSSDVAPPTQPTIEDSDPSSSNG